MSPVIWSDRAKGDLWDIGGYWSRHNPARTAEIADRIDDAAAFIASAPHAGPTIGEARTRKWRVAGTDYVLIYLILPDTVEIVRVHHVRQNWRDPD